MPVSDRILATKLLAPRIGARLIDRARLLALFDGFDRRKLSLVTAPAGYGKSVLVSQFTGTLDCPVVWYHLDPFDNDPAVFMQYLAAGVARHFPGFGAGALEPAGKGGAPAELVRRLVTAMVNELAARLDRQLVIVLDDYHVIAEALVHNLVKELLFYLPERVHLVIAGRAAPPLALERMKMAAMVVHIGWEELRFNRSEIAAFLAAELKRPVPDHTVTAVEEETGGWPAALRLTGVSPGGAGAARQPSVPAGAGGRREIYNYLAAEVLGGISPELESFVRATAVLDVLTPSICNALLDRADAREILAELEARNLFLVALEGEGEEQAYRYHHLFRDFFRERLAAEEKKELLRQAGRCYLEAGSPGLAVEYYLQAGCFPEAAAVLEKAGGRALRRGRWKTLQRWLDSFPENMLREQPWLLLLEGALLIMHGRTDRAAPLVEQALAAFERAGDAEGLLQARLHRARILRSRGAYKESLALLDEILPELQRRPVIEWYDACLEQSFALTLQGKLEAAARLLNHALAVAEREKEDRIAAQVAEKLGELYYFKGEYSRAVEVHQRAVEMASDPQRATYSIRDNIAVIYRDWGDLDQAFEYARKSIEIKESLGLQEALPYAYHQLAIILADLGETAAAEDNFRRAIDMARETGGEAFFLTLSTALYGRLLGVLERLDEARVMVDRAIEAAAGQSPFIYGICLEVAAPIYEQTGERDKAVRMLHRAIEILEPIGAKYSLCVAHGALARTFLNRGDPAGARKHAARCFELAAAESYLQMFLTYRVMLLPVVMLGLEEGFQPHFLCEILKRLSGEAAEMLLALCAHADPAVRCRTIAPLAGIGGEKEAAALRALLGDPDETVRDHALAAVQALGKKTTPRGRAPVRPGPAKQPATILPGPGAPLLEIRCLGPFCVRAGDRELAWRTNKARDLFAFLTHYRGRVVSKEKILEELWPEADPEHSSTLFHTNLYQLRKAVRSALGERSVVRHSAGQYRLDWEAFSCDAAAFETLVKAVPGEDRPAAKARLAEALALYRGDYMEGLDYEWAAAERDRLAELYLAVLKQLAAFHGEDGEHAEAVSCLRAILRINPLLEEAYARLMSAYAAMGDRLAVMQQYETLCKILEDELGIDPAPATRELYYKLCGEKA